MQRTLMPAAAADAVIFTIVLRHIADAFADAAFFAFLLLMLPLRRYRQPPISRPCAAAAIRHAMFITRR